MPVHDVSVIGIGRVGLPLALAFADRGLRTLGVDVDPTRVGAVSEGRMPFWEPGAEEVLARVREAGRLEVTSEVARAAEAEHVVLTLGTPSFSHIEIDVEQIRTVLDALVGHLRPGQTISLRSTIAPGTTEWVAGYLEQRHGLRPDEDVRVAHVPERIAAGRFFAEIDALPCIVAGVGERSTEAAAELFAHLGAPIVRCTPVEAELAKIWTNILRYAEFALPNRLMMECEQHGANVFEVIDLINRDYPRGGMKLPGLTAGTCLRKDFTFSEERSTAPGMLLAVSRVHETVPLFLVEGLKRRIVGGTLRGRRVALLGLAFKGDTDDERDSLAFKIRRLLERELALVAASDPHSPSSTLTLDEAVRDADAVVLATNHSAWQGPETLRHIAGLAAPGALLADPWNCFDQREVFGAVDELSARGGEPPVVAPVDAAPPAP